MDYATEKVKNMLSNKWEDSLIESLQNQEHCAIYLESALEEKNIEHEFLKEIITDIMTASQQMNNLSPETQLLYEKLVNILTKTGGEEIYTFMDFINTLGLKLEIKIKSKF
jgi:DNA-binding phage protein